MSDVTQMRLSKVAKEFNLSLGKITEFLAAKGRTIENNPNAKIGADEYALLSKEFSGDKSAKEEALNAGITLNKLKRDSVIIEDFKTIKAREAEENRIKDAEIAAAKKAGETKRAEEKKQEEERIVAAKAVIKKAQEEKEEKEAAKAVKAPTSSTAKKKSTEEPAIVEPLKEDILETETINLTGPKVLGKVDLSTLNQKTKPDKKTKKAKEDEAKEEAKIAAEKGKKKKVVDEAVAAPVSVPVQEIIIDTPKVIEAEESKEVFHETVYQKLEGPKIMGKIELPVHKEPVKGESFADKKKRKRIKKGGVSEAEIKKVGAEQAQSAKDRAKEKYGDPRGVKKPGTTGFVPREARPALTDDEIQKQIKETLARLSQKGGKSQTSKNRRDKRDVVRERLADEQVLSDAEKSVLKVTEFVSANQLATMMEIPVNKIIATCMSLGLFVSINQRLDAETIAIVAEEFGFKTE